MTVMPHRFNRGSIFCPRCLLEVRIPSGSPSNSRSFTSVLRFNGPVATSLVERGPDNVRGLSANFAAKAAYVRRRSKCDDLRYRLDVQPDNLTSIIPVCTVQHPRSAPSVRSRCRRRIVLENVASHDHEHLEQTATIIASAAVDRCWRCRSPQSAPGVDAAVEVQKSRPPRSFQQRHRGRRAFAVTAGMRRSDGRRGPHRLDWPVLQEGCERRPECVRTDIHPAHARRQQVAPSSKTRCASRAADESGARHGRPLFPQAACHHRACRRTARSRRAADSSSSRSTGVSPATKSNCASAGTSHPSHTANASRKAMLIEPGMCAAA